MYPYISSDNVTFIRFLLLMFSILSVDSNTYKPEYRSLWVECVAKTRKSAHNVNQTLSRFYKHYKSLYTSQSFQRIFWKKNEDCYIPHFLDRFTCIFWLFDINLPQMMPRHKEQLSLLPLQQFSISLYPAPVWLLYRQSSSRFCGCLSRTLRHYDIMIPLHAFVCLTWKGSQFGCMYGERNKHYDNDRIHRNDWKYTIMKKGRSCIPFQATLSIWQHNRVHIDLIIWS